jgi:hypothetical protein
VVAVCFRSSKGILPQGGSCSAIISAACHGPTGDTGAALKPVKWGEIEVAETDDLIAPEYISSYIPEERGLLVNGPEMNVQEVEFNWTGHCCFTTYDVNTPVAGKYYY